MWVKKTATSSPERGIEKEKERDHVNEKKLVDTHGEQKWKEKTQNGKLKGGRVERIRSMEDRVGNGVGGQTLERWRWR